MELTSRLRLYVQVSLSNLTVGQALNPRSHLLGISLSKRVRQVDEHDSEHVGEHEEQDDNKSREGDAKVDFAALAVSYSTTDTRYKVSDEPGAACDEPGPPPAEGPAPPEGRSPQLAMTVTVVSSAVSSL